MSEGPQCPHLQRFSPKGPCAGPEPVTSQARTAGLTHGHGSRLRPSNGHAAPRRERSAWAGVSGWSPCPHPEDLEALASQPPTPSHCRVPRQQPRWLPNPAPEAETAALSHDRADPGAPGPGLPAPTLRVRPPPAHLGGREEGIVRDQAVLVVRPQQQRALGQGQHEGPLCEEGGRAEPGLPGAQRGGRSPGPGTPDWAGEADEHQVPIYWAQSPSERPPSTLRRPWRRAH